MWLKELKTHASPDIKIFLIGNKIDLEDSRKVTTEEAKKFQTDYDLNLYMETSAKTGFNAKEIFIEAAKVLVKEYNEYKRADEEKKIKLQIWDTCGQEIYRSLITNFYRNSSLAIIVYSIDKKNSFKDIELWLKELRLYSSPDIKVILIGNKSDLKDKREVTYEEVVKYLEDDRIMSFYETSAKTGENVSKLFEEIGIALYKDYRRYKTDESMKSNSTVLSKSEFSQAKSCC